MCSVKICAVLKIMQCYKYACELHLFYMAWAYVHIARPCNGVARACDAHARPCKVAFVSYGMCVLWPCMPMQWSDMGVLHKQHAYVNGLLLLGFFIIIYLFIYLFNHGPTYTGVLYYSMPVLHSNNACMKILRNT